MGFAGADEDEADEEEWDENAAETEDATTAAVTGQDTDAEVTRRESGKGTKGGSRRRGGKEDGEKAASSRPEKKRRAPRWSKKVGANHSCCRGMRSGGWTGMCSMGPRTSKSLECSVLVGTFWFLLGLDGGDLRPWPSPESSFPSGI